MRKVEIEFWIGSDNGTRSIWISGNPTEEQIKKHFWSLIEQEVGPIPIVTPRTFKILSNEPSSNGKKCFGHY